MPQPFVTRALLVAAMSCLSATAAQSQVLSEWLNPVNGDWDAPANWSTPAFPNNAGGTTYDVLIAAGGASGYEVRLRGGQTLVVDTITLNDTNAILFLDGADLTSALIDVMAGALITNQGTLRNTQITATGSATPISWRENGETDLDNVRLSADVDCPHDGSETLAFRRHL